MSSPVSTAGVVSFEEARRIVEEHAAKVRLGVVQFNNAESDNVEVLDLLSSRGRILAETLVADRDFPPFARAVRDGYAVRAADVEHAPARLEVIGEVKAGDSLESSAVGPGQAVSIMTGAPLPAGADAVVMVEYTAPSGKDVEIQRSVKSGENFVPRGAEARAGQTLVESGRRLDHSLMAIAAAVGDRMTVMLDSGVRRGADILIALCLGADFCFFGRPTLYGAVAGGLDGVKKAVDIFRGEIDLVMGQIGCPSLDQLGPDFLWQEDWQRNR